MEIGLLPWAQVLVLVTRRLMNDEIRQPPKKELLGLTEMLVGLTKVW